MKKNELIKSKEGLSLVKRNKDVKNSQFAITNDDESSQDQSLLQFANSMWKDIKDKQKDYFTKTHLDSSFTVRSD